MGNQLVSRDWAHNKSLKYMPKEDRYFLNPPKPELVFNVIGTGVNGQEHIRCTHFESRATIKGVYDPNPGSIEGAKKEHAKFTDRPLVIYKSIEEACNDKDIDGIIISTPNYTHLEVLRTAMESHKPILLEKPMATTIEDAHAILEKAQNYDSILQLGLQYRYKAMYRESIYEVLKRQSLGDVKLMYICEHRIPFLDKVGQWNKFSKKSGGTLVEKCCHYFDLFNLFAQSRPKRVFASGSQFVNFVDYAYKGEASDILDNAVVTIEYDNDVLASFNLSMFAPQFYEELSICGSEGRLRCFEKQDFPGGEESEVYLEILRGELKPARIIKPRYPHTVERLGHHGSTLMEHGKFVDNIIAGELTSATAEEGFWAVVIGVAAEQSVKTRQPVIVDELLEEMKIPLCSSS